MSCEFEEDLTAFVDGELPALRARQVEAHLGTCAACAATQKRVRGAVAQLAVLSAQEAKQATAATALKRSVLSRLDEPVGLSEKLRALWRPGLLVPALGLAAAAAVAVVALTRPHHELRLESTEQALFAQNGDVLEDFDVVGLESVDDLEVVQHLHELEATP